ncbi:MAG: geranylgeranyl reductase family protein [Planctomycetia bacterium]|nr:geranylgeranyl reductase family protein [Candidatus Brocadia sp.]QOJ05926.1 MAG: geranylgeranyl reductase family protein [Planctomycetia bacterium]TVL95948.1 MAG: hypothetical protein CV082_09010 [Candidatus Brocadia sp. BL1]HQU31091.1 geranylgeranyl reductase family protein [Candidatus Brocadia sapporoensis]
MIFDVIIVGAGPAGSSTATFLSRQGLKVLFLDKAIFPRDKVCGDCLAPQALYWLDELGCVDEVLNHADTCITSGDVLLKGKYLFTGDFPQDTLYPGFCTLLERAKLDHIMVKNAVKNGAVFKPNCLVKSILIKEDCVEVTAVSEGTVILFRGKLLVGADGANSIVSRSLGNVLREGTTAISVRAYYKNVKIESSKIQIHINDKFFPGMGWVFTDSRRKANIGIGYIFDKRFPGKDSLKKVFDGFIRHDLKKCLKGAKQVSPVAGWWASFFKPGTLVSDRVILIGDAANLADPMNGAGIHKAMESAYVASQVIAHCIAIDDYSSASLNRYELLWNKIGGFDWQIRQLFLSIAKNPNIREIYMLLIKYIARLAKINPKFKDFCGGVFSGTITVKGLVLVEALLSAFPADLSAWITLSGNSTRRSIPFDDALLAGISILKTISRFTSNPMGNFNWGVEVLNNAIGTASNIMLPSLFSAGIDKVYSVKLNNN